MKASPTHGSQAPTSAHGTALTAASSNQHTYPHDTPARSPGSTGTCQVASSFQVDDLPHGTGRRLGNSDSTRNVRAVRVATRRSATASAFNRHHRTSRTAAARSLEHCPGSSDYIRSITELSESLLVSQPSSQRPTTYVWARPRKGIESVEPEPFRVVIMIIS